MSNFEKLLSQSDKITAPGPLGDRLRQAVDGELAVSAGMATGTKLFLSLLVLSTVGALGMVAMSLWGPADKPRNDRGSADGVAVEKTDGMRTGARADHHGADLNDHAAAANGNADHDGGAGIAATDGSEEHPTHLPGGTPAIVGIVTDEAGRPIAGAPLRVKLGPGSGLASTEVITDATGAYRVQLATLFQKALDQRQSGSPMSFSRETTATPVEQRRAEFAAEKKMKKKKQEKESRRGRRVRALAAPTLSPEGQIEFEVEQIVDGELTFVEPTIETWTTLGSNPVNHRLRAAIELGSQGIVEVDARTLGTDHRAVEEEYERLAQMVQMQTGRSHQLAANQTQRIALEELETIARFEQYNADRADVVIVELESLSQELIQAEADLKKQRSLELNGRAMLDVELGSSFSFTVSVLTAGYQPVIESFSLEGNELVTLDLVLPEAERVHGVVLDTTGRPIAGATITVVASHIEVSGEARTTVTDPQGLFDLASLPEGQYLVRASADGFSSNERALHTGPNPMIFQLRAAAMLNVEVQHSAACTLARWQLYRDGQFVRQFSTSAELGYQVHGLAPGAYELHAFPNNSTHALETCDIVLAAGENWVTVDVPDPVIIEGQILADADQNLEKFMVVAYYLDAIGAGTSARAGTRYANADGTFQIEGLARGDYQIGIATQVSHGWGLRQLVQVHASGPRTAVTIPFAPVEFGRLVVRARDHAGNPVSGASVTMNRESIRSGATRPMGKSGDYSIELHPDRFHLSIDAPGYQPVELERDVAEGEEVVVEVTLRAEPDLNALLARLFEESEPVRLYESLTLRSYLALMEQRAPGSVAVGEELAASGFLDTLRVDASPRVTPALHLGAVIRRLGISWSVQRGQLLLERAPQK